MKSDRIGIVLRPGSCGSSGLMAGSSGSVSSAGSRQLPLRRGDTVIRASGGRGRAMTHCSAGLPEAGPIP
eukprot:676101-Hanusia_phi.AAC.1